MDCTAVLRKKRLCLAVSQAILGTTLLAFGQTSIGQDEAGKTQITPTQNGVNTTFNKDHWRAQINVGHQEGLFAEGVISFVNQAQSSGVLLSVKKAPELERFLINAGFSIGESGLVSFGAARLNKDNDYNFGFGISREEEVQQNTYDLAFSLGGFDAQQLLDDLKFRVTYHDTDGKDLGIVGFNTTETATEIRIDEVLGQIVGGDKLISQLETSLRISNQLKLLATLGYERQEFDRQFSSEEGVTGSVGLAYRPSDRHFLSLNHRAGEVSDNSTARYDYVLENGISFFATYEHLKNTSAGQDDNDDVWSLGLSVPLGHTGKATVAPLYTSGQKNSVSHHRLAPSSQLQTELVQTARAHAELNHIVTVDKTAVGAGSSAVVDNGNVITTLDTGLTNLVDGPVLGATAAASSFSIANNQLVIQNTQNLPAPATIIINVAQTGGSNTLISLGTTQGSVILNQSLIFLQNVSSSDTNAVIGGSKTFAEVQTAMTADTTPETFSFTDQTDVALNTQTESNTITVAGINTSAAISIAGGEYSVNGGSYTNAAGNVNSGDTVKVRLTSSANHSTATSATLTIGGTSDSFDVTTLSEEQECTSSGGFWDGITCHR